MTETGLNESSLDYTTLSNMFNLFKNTFEKGYEKLELRAEMEAQLFERVIMQYSEHASRYEIHIRQVCPYKIYAWAGFILAEMLYSERNKTQQTLCIQALSTSIRCMLKTLKQEGIELEESFHKKALHMALTEIMGNKNVQDEDKNERYIKIGLGMNGLYMMFRSASVCQKLVTKNKKYRITQPANKPKRT